MLLFTSAEIDNQKELRTQDYNKSLDWLKKNTKDLQILVLETVKPNNSCLILEDVFYSNTHNVSFSNKGANLGLALKEFCINYKLPEDETIIVMTGRYIFLDTYFFDIIKKDFFDFYGKVFHNCQYFTGAFAMKFKYLKERVINTNWYNLNTNNINIEKNLFDYVINSKISACNLDKINIECKIFGTGKLENIIV